MHKKTPFSYQKSKKNSGEGAQAPPPVGLPTLHPFGAFGASISTSAPCVPNCLQVQIPPWLFEEERLVKNVNGI